MRSLAVFFPGIGYTVDKPLLYYSRKLAEKAGFELMPLSFSGFPKKAKGDQDKMRDCFQLALRQSRQLLADVRFESCDQILFVAKSIGTAAAAQLAAESAARDRIRCIFYTPLEETFAFPFADAIVFTGTADPWLGKDRNPVPALCSAYGIPCVVIPDANHSLESGDPLRDIEQLHRIMSVSERFISRGRAFAPEGEMR